MADDRITSLQNPKIKELLELMEKSKVRKEKGMFVVEGLREVTHCIESGYQIRTIFFCPSILPEEDLPRVDAPVFEVSTSVYEKVAYRGSTEGIIAEFSIPQHRKLELGNLLVAQSPLIMVLESVEKPGNLGAALRTADAAGVDGVIICDPLTDIYNPNLIRASLGGVFTQSVVTCSSEEAVAWLKKLGIKIFTAQLQDSQPYYDADMTGPMALVFGAESAGLSEIWRKASDQKIYIPMLGKLDSLNVSVSAAILCYEAVRQRQSL